MPLNADDRFAVHDLLYRYAHFHDSKQPGRIAAEIFTADAVIDFGTGPVTGRAAIAAFFASFPAFLGTSHNITNVMVEGEGDRARAQCHCLAWQWIARPDVEGRPSIHPSDTLAVGGYQDELVRTPEGWRISARRTVQYGTGLGVGIAREPVRSLLEGALGRLPDWP